MSLIRGTGKQLLILTSFQFNPPENLSPGRWTGRFTSTIMYARLG
jgi:hypothetical protein